MQTSATDRREVCNGVEGDRSIPSRCHTSNPKSHHNNSIHYKLAHVRIGRTTIIKPTTDVHTPVHIISSIPISSVKRSVHCGMRAAMMDGTVSRCWVLCRLCLRCTGKSCLNGSERQQMAPDVRRRPQKREPGVRNHAQLSNTASKPEGRAGRSSIHNTIPNAERQ